MRTSNTCRPFLAHFSFNLNLLHRYLGRVRQEIRSNRGGAWRLNSWFIYARETAGRNRRSMKTLFPRTFE